MARQIRSGDNEGREMVQQIPGRIQRHKPRSIKILRDGPIARTAFRISPSSVPQSEAGSIHETISDYGDT